MAIGRSLGGSGNFSDDLFRKHLDLNNKLKSSLERISKYIKRIHTLDDVEKKEVMGTLLPATFGRFSVGAIQTRNSEISQIRTIFDSIEWEDKEILKLLEGDGGLISIIDSENAEIGKFLVKKNGNPVDRSNIVEILISNYNASKQRVWEKLRTLLGQNETYRSTMLSRVEKDVDTMVIEYLDRYKNLENLILNKDSKNDMRWDGIYNVLNEIVEELAILRGTKFQDTFVNSITNKAKKTKVSERTFAENYFTHPNTFVDYFRIYGEKYKEYVIYSKLPEEQKKDIDKLLSNSCKLLFKGITVIEDKLKVDSESNDPDFDKLKSEFEIAYLDLEEKLRSESKFVGRLEECGIYGEDGITEGLKFKDFRKDSLKSGKTYKPLIERVIKYVLSITRKTSTFNKFKTYNSSHFNDGSSGHGSTGSMTDTEIKKAKDEFLKRVKAVAVFIKKIREHKNGEDETQIITDLKNALEYFLNISKDDDERKEMYKELFSKGFKNTINDTDVKMILNYSESIINSSDLRYIANTCISLLAEFERLKCFDNLNDFVNKA